MRKLFTPIGAALVALTALAATTQQADARRYRGAVAFGVASAIIGGAIIGSRGRHYGYYGYGGYDRYPYDYGYGYNYSRYSAAYDYDDDYGDDYYDYAPRRSYYYYGGPAYSYGYAPRRFIGGYRIIHPRRHHHAKFRNDHRGKHVHKARYRD